MKRSVFLLAILVGVFATGAVALGQASFSRGPYSGAPSADSVVISWILSSSAPAKLEISPVDATDARETFPRVLIVPASTDKHGQVDVLVDGLEPATAYVYRAVVQSGSERTASPIGHFKTAPLPGAAVTFAVLADTQWQWEGTNRLAVMADAIAFDSARSGGFDFVLHAGDLVETPNDYYWPHWFSSFEPMLLAAPFIPVLGNHEKNSVSYYNAFSHPAGAGLNNERWWTLHWGDVLVVGLDTSVTRADQILEQQAYAREQLSGPERWKFVVFHHPVFSSDANYGSYSYDKIYHPIFVEKGVDVVFNGHAHNYERVERDGVVYLVVGGGGALPAPFAATRVEGSVKAITGRNFYARVAVTSQEIGIDIVSVAEVSETTYTLTPGELLDSFTLRAPVAETETALAVAPAESPEVAPEATPTLAATGGVVASEAATIVAAPEGVALVSSASAREALGAAINIGVAVLAAGAALVAVAVWILARIGW